MAIPDPSLSVTDLFVPSPSGVGPFGGANVQGNWLSEELLLAAKVGLPTTSFDPFSPELVILSIEAVTFSESDLAISLLAQGGFLQTAASGSVTTTPVYGAGAGIPVTIPVTPDPSNAAQNPTGQLGPLDLLCQSTYGTARIASTFASGTLAIANLKGSTIGPYAAGSYHVGTQSQPGNAGSTYHNTASLTVPSSVIAGTGGVVAGVAPGVSSTVITTVSAHGLAAGAVVYVVVPTSAGISGLAGVFAVVTAVTPITFAIGVGSSGTWTAGGNVYAATTGAFQADVTGPGSNAAPGSVTQTITQNVNVFVSNVSAWAGNNWESNSAYASRTLLSLASRSPNGPSQAYVYFADTASQLLAADTPEYTLTNGPVIASSSGNPQTGVQTTVVASLSPASSVLGANVTPGCSQLPISGVTNANPAVISCTGPTSLAPGGTMTVTISGVLGSSGVSGSFVASYVTADSFSIPVDTTLAGTYTGGGSVEGGDLGQIDALLQLNATPDGITSITVSALALPVTITAQVAVPQAYVATYQLAAPAQLQTQISAYALGGNSPGFAVAYDDIVSALEEAGVLTFGAASYVREIVSLAITVGGVSVPIGGSVPFPSSQYQAILVAPTIGVVGI